jgi:hypothetical protein
MKVYRIENALGQGFLYRANWTDTFVLPEDEEAYTKECGQWLSTDKHQSPPYRMVELGQVFGCPSLEYMAEWINPNILDMLERAGYKVYVYSTKLHTKHPTSPNQVSFKKKNAVLIEAFHLDILRNIHEPA